ncbi:MAG TPA: UPF0149 family protein [Acetobacteraceae bacterium]|jgi:uncharacterized protein YgfB (UPF0149 family)|nr:UPF0149 family protein [Acetobacteraceae bacterium]
MTTIAYAKSGAALAQAKLGIGPAELHGSVVGYLCAGWTGSAHELLSALQLESDGAGAVDALHAWLDELVPEVVRELDAGKPITPLLPEAPLSARADAMVDWCRGFLGGLGLTGVLAAAGLAPATRELLDDFGRIASTRIECEDDDDAALAEVLDFIGSGVAHLHAALAPTGRP